ncbi:MAG: hypothetical protein H7175_00770 [Burkholderiales bacterium]|nr:hypothetical protein [Anaerolineae bacterium]
MLRLVFRPLLLMSMLLAMCIGLIRAQPNEASGLGDFLFRSSGCEAYTEEPCFMGLRPGITTTYEAVDMLIDHAWVSRVYDDELRAYSSNAFIGAILWEWSGQPPQWANTTERSFFYVRNYRVQSIIVRTKASLGDAWLLLGAPEGATAFCRDAPGQVAGQAMGAAGAAQQEVIFQALYNSQFGFDLEEREPVRRVWELPLRFWYGSDLSFLLASGSSSPNDLWQRCHPRQS